MYDGTASFVSDDTVKVVSHNKKEILLKGKEVFINTGATDVYKRQAVGSGEEILAPVVILGIDKIA